MNSTHWNGSFPQVGAPQQFARHLSSNSRRLSSSPSRPSCDQPVVSLAVYKAQRRRAAIAAQAAARRRTVVCLALCLLGLVAGAVARQLDSRVQVVEVRR